VSHLADRTWQGRLATAIGAAQPAAFELGAQWAGPRQGHTKFNTATRTIAEGAAGGSTARALGEQVLAAEYGFFCGISPLPVAGISWHHAITP